MDDIGGLDRTLRVLGVKYLCLGSGVNFPYVWPSDRRLVARNDIVPQIDVVYSYCHIAIVCSEVGFRACE